MMMKLTVNYVSGKTEQFEIDIYGGSNAEHRFQDFAKDPTLVLKTDTELIVIPAHAIQSLILSLPAGSGEQVPIKDVRKAKRLK